MKEGKFSGRTRPGKQAALLVVAAAGMFGFAFALVPLYEVFCELTGLNGRTSSQAASAELSQPASNREVTIQLLGQVSKGLPWEFRPLETRLRVRVGETHVTRYYARNRSARAVSGQAVPSVAPGAAAPYLRKIECFCFTQQRLEAGAEAELPVQLYVDADLPEDIRTLSLSYTFFPIDAAEAAGATHSGAEHEAR